MDIRGNVCLITGGSGGIGEALARELAIAGARVVLFARRAKELDRVVQAIGGGQAVAVAGDVTNPADLQRAVDTALSRFGRLDVLVNNAGIGAMGTLATIPPASVERVWRVNVLGAILAYQAALPAIRKPGGLIVNIASVAGTRGLPGLGAYGSSKAALIQLSDTMRNELRSEGVRVLNIHPGYLANDFMDNATYEGDTESAERIRQARRSRTSEDAARDIIAAIRADLDDWRFEQQASR